MARETDKYNISSGQEFLTNWLQKLGLIVESEKNIGRFRVDIYLPEIKTVVEFDGPHIHHSERREELRDKELKFLGVREVIHIEGTSKKELLELSRRLGYEGT